MKISAYLIVHADDDFLRDALATVYDRVDEIVVVDGAYEWVAPFFARAGLDPGRSPESTHAALAPFARKIRYFDGVWRDELHKRGFAFAQCSGEVVFRIDADELFEFDEPALAAFLASDAALAQVAIPQMVTPTLQVRPVAQDREPLLGAVFRRDRYPDPQTHCAHLWLVLTADERSRVGKADWSGLFPDPVARVAHLTRWRTPRTAVNRQRYYSLQHTRSTGHIPWEHRPAPAAFDPQARLEQIFETFTPQAYTSFLEGQRIVSGFPDMEGHQLIPTRFGPDTTAAMTRHHAAYRASLEALSRFRERRRVLANGVGTYIDLTHLGAEGIAGVTLRFDQPPRAASARIELLSEAQVGAERPLSEGLWVRTEGRRLHVRLDRRLDAPGVLQASLLVTPQFRVDTPLAHLIGLRAWSGSEHPGDDEDQSVGSGTSMRRKRASRKA